MYSIYLIRSEIEHIVQWKIGITKNKEQRLLELRTANPNIIGFEDSFEIRDRDIAYKVEALLKTQLEQYCIGGEWVEEKALDKKKFSDMCIKAEKNIMVWKGIQTELEMSKKIDKIYKYKNKHNL